MRTSSDENHSFKIITISTVRFVWLICEWSEIRAQEHRSPGGHGIHGLELCSFESTEGAQRAQLISLPKSQEFIFGMGLLLELAHETIVVQ